MERKQIPWDLLVKHFKGEASSEEEVALNAWRIIPGNDVVFAELRTLWLSIVKEGTGYVSQADRLWQQMDLRINGHKEEKKQVAKEIRFSSNKFRWLSAAASLLLLFSCSLTGYMGKQWYDANTIAQTYTSLNGKSKISLPDGSEVWLNAQSRLEYKTTAWSRERQVTLDGEAYFDVAKDASRPFIVKNQSFRVKVHGTTFNVEARDKSNNIQVSLLSGSVDVSSANEERRLQPGETAICMKNSGQISVEKTDAGFAALWGKESVRFERQSIKELAKYLSRWYGVKITLDPSIPADQAYTFTVRHKSFEEILRLMARIHPIRYSFNENNEVTISRKQKKQKRV